MIPAAPRSPSPSASSGAGSSGTGLSGKPPSGLTPPARGMSERTRWHMWANTPMVLWMLGLIVVAVAHRWIPAASWLLIHLLMLGAVTNAILVWSQHFTDALLRRRIGPGDRRWQTGRMVLLNMGVATVVTGMVLPNWPATLTGAIVVGLAVAAHGTALMLQARKALAPRFAVLVKFYVAAAWLLPVGAGFGATIAHGVGGGWQNRLTLAHAGFNLLGFVGLTVVGTLITLWPTMLRTKMADSSLPAAKRALVLLLAGIGVAAVGVLTGVQPVAAAGVLVYLGGLVSAWVPMFTAARRRPPATFSTWSAAAAATWLTGSIAVLAGILAFSPTWEVVSTRIGMLTAPLLAGFAAQILLAALTYLAPVVLGGGPAAVRASTASLERAAVLRVILVNGGLLVYILPAPSIVNVLFSSLVLGVYASFLPLVALSIRAGRRARGSGPLVRPRTPQTSPAASAGSPSATGPASPKTSAAKTTVNETKPAKQGPPVGAVTGPRRTGLAVTAISILALAAAAGVALDPIALGTGGTASTGTAAATGETTVVQVETKDMRFFPSSIDVPAGNNLILEITNVDSDVHDLALDTGHNSGRIAPGASATLEVGVVGRDIDGWCTVVGHRQMGMVMTINTIGGSGPVADDVPGTEPTPGTGHEAHMGGVAGTGAAADLDFMAEPGDDFEAHPAILPPASTATHHELTMTVAEIEAEVAPGVTQKLWTFNGTAPGPTLRGKVGDTFDITLINDGTIGHSIDFHAGSLAPDEPMRTLPPGEQLTYKFTATMSGIWMYHCGTMPMTAHIANGMFGAVIIDPPNLPEVDHEYVIVQSEFYLGEQGEPVDFDKLAADQPDIVAFNGYANQYDFEPLPARVGERVRFWVLPVGPNRSTSFHIVGGQFDTVFKEGAYRLRPDNPEAGGGQALGLATAQGGFVEMTFPEAGNYPMVSHIMIDAERGAHGFVRVSD